MRARARVLLARDGTVSARLVAGSLWSAAAGTARSVPAAAGRVPPDGDLSFCDRRPRRTYVTAAGADRVATTTGWRSTRTVPKLLVSSRGGEIHRPPRRRAQSLFEVPGNAGSLRGAGTVADMAA